MECPDDGELAQFVERALPEPRRADVERHLEGCDACRDVVLVLVEAFAERESIPQSDVDRSVLPSKGSTLGRYVIIDWIGAGAMGAVYAAFDPELDRKVALKLLPPRRGKDDEQLRARFLSEARAMASLSHPNVISVHDVGQRGDIAFFAMELIDGPTLAQWRTEDDRSVAAIVDVFSEAGQGLAAAHAAGLVHRDFKPANALIGKDGRVCVIDFGLARFAAESEDTQPPDQRSAAPGHGTRTGTLLGTPAYMAPEQLERKPADALSDQFAFSVSLYEALHGRRPFAGTTLAALAESIAKGPADMDAAVPRRVRRVLARGLSERPEQRYPSMDALLADLTARPLRRWGPTAVVAIAASGVALAVNSAVSGDAGIVCDPAPSGLEQAWNADRRQALLDAVSRDWDDARAGRWIVARIDAYADAWNVARHDVCTATLERHEQSFAMMDRQMICLGRARAQLQANVGVLLEQGAIDVDTIPRFVERLPSIDACRDVETLEAGPAPPLPDASEAVDAQREVLAEAKARYLADDFEGSGTMAAQVVEAAEAIGYAPLRYEARLARATANYRMSELDAAEQDLNEVLEETLGAGDRTVAARAAATLSCLATTQRGKPQAGLAYARTALGLTRSMKGESSLRAHAMRCSARALKEDGRYADAEARLRDAIAILDADGQARGLELSRDRAELGQLLKRRRNYADAEEELRRARAVLEDTLGGGTVFGINLSGEIAAAMVSQGRYDDAEAEFEGVIEAWTKVSGPRTPNIGLAHGKLGNLYYARGSYEQAEASFRSARRILGESFDADHPALIGTDASLANVLSQQGKLSDAVDLYLDALTRQEKSASSAHPSAVHLRASAGNALMQLGRFDEAIATVEPSITACADEDVPRQFCGDLELVRSRSELGLGNATAAARSLEAVREFYGDEEQGPDTQAVIDEIERGLTGR